MQLEDPDAGARESRQALRSVLELDRGVAHVVAKAEMAPDCPFGSRLVEIAQVAEAIDGRRREEMLLEEPHRLLDGLEVAHGLGLERQRDGPSGLLLQADQMAGMTQEVVGNRLDRTRLLADRTKGCRHRADAPLQLRIVRQQRGQEIGETIGVGKPLRKAPVGLIHLLLHARPVEGSVRKPIDGEDVETFAGKEILEAIELARH